ENSSHRAHNGDDFPVWIDGGLAWPGSREVLLHWCLNAWSRGSAAPRDGRLGAAKTRIPSVLVLKWRSLVMPYFTPFRTCVGWNSSPAFHVGRRSALAMSRARTRW